MTENVPQKNKKKRPYQPLKQNYYTLHPHPLRPRSSVGGLELQQISLLFGLGRSLRHLCLSEGRYEVRAQVLGGLVVPEVGREAAPHNAVEDCASGSQALVGVRGRAAPRALQLAKYCALYSPLGYAGSPRSTSRPTSSPTSSGQPSRLVADGTTSYANQRLASAGTVLYRIVWSGFDL